MLEIDPAAPHFEIDAQRLDLVEEFRRAPRGPHSDELQRVLHRMRWAGEDHRYCMVVVEPGRKWMLGRLPAQRGRPVETFSDKVFFTTAEIEWEVFCRRWEALTGHPLPPELRNSKI